MTLLEVLLTLAIFLVGSVGIIGLFVAASVLHKDAVDRRTAAYIGETLLAHVQAQPMREVFAKTVVDVDTDGEFPWHCQPRTPRCCGERVTQPTLQAQPQTAITPPPSSTLIRTARRVPRARSCRERADFWGTIAGSTQFGLRRRQRLHHPDHAARAAAPHLALCAVGGGLTAAATASVAVTATPRADA